MYKPTDIVAVYGECRGGGNLINDSHPIGSVDDKMHSEPTFCEVVSTHGKNIIVKNKQGVNSIISSYQCRLAKRDGKMVEPKKSKFCATISHENIGNHLNFREEFDSLDGIKNSYNELVDICEADSEDIDEITFTVRKYIDITEEVDFT